MKTIKVTLEFDEKDLGEKWMNPDNLDLLLYSDLFTNRNLLKVVAYQEIKPDPNADKMNETKKKEWENKFTQLIPHKISNDAQPQIRIWIDLTSPESVWNWIESSLKEARVDENKYWIEYVSRFGAENMPRYFKNANKHNFLDRIKELEKE